MQIQRFLFLFSAVLCGCLASDVQANPLSKVLELMADLSAKIKKEGDVADTAYGEYFSWCDDRAKTAGAEIKTATSKQEKLEATIQELTSDVNVAISKVEKLAAAIAADNAELAKATTIRKKELAEFQANEAELMDVVATCEQAIKILKKEMQKKPAAFAQLDTSSSMKLAQTLGTMVEAAGFAGADRDKLLALVQSQQGAQSDADADVDNLGAPDAESYQSHSSNIIDVLEDILEKAEASLKDLRNVETTNRHNFDMMKQSLKDQMSADTKDMEDEKAGKAEAEEGKATAAGELKSVTKMLANTKDELEKASQTCMQVAADHEGSVKARQEELKAITSAMKILQETSGGAASKTYSFLQRTTSTARLGMQAHSDLAGSEVIRLVKQLARRHHSAALAQLASRMIAAIRFGRANGANPFGKVIGMIKSMIEKLEKEGKQEASEKAYCDDEMAKTEAKKGELKDDVSKLTAKIDQGTAKSASLMEDIRELEAELAKIAKSQSEMDKIRQTEHSAFVEGKQQLELGLRGVRQALQVLRDYYGSEDSFLQQPAAPTKSSKSGAGANVIGILEVVEDDFATALAKGRAEEEDEQAAYEEMTQRNTLTKTIKNQDLKFKSKQAKGLKKSTSDLSADRDAINTELTAVNDYYAKLKDRCVAKPETYEARKARRENEINGLKQALQSLDTEAAFFQRSGGRRNHHMRGSLTEP
eukprot:CAMPEP_0172706318 /NCGR_PEP_ID=MMETSP1074-20121228/45915_1 /TAXON_ID=2916 /ORGANISM="Ceratium fusus, Strain PA161109" /LENGTH=705 /DNA_ID=CAMNT_0013528867 /DNA_START=58 /DNA_END=2175 /DNA_ORIENTATION=-